MINLISVASAFACFLLRIKLSSGISPSFVYDCISRTWNPPLMCNHHYNDCPPLIHRIYLHLSHLFPLSQWVLPSPNLWLSSLHFSQNSSCTRTYSRTLQSRLFFSHKQRAFFVSEQTATPHSFVIFLFLSPKAIWLGWLFSPFYWHICIARPLFDHPRVVHHDASHCYAGSASRRVTLFFLTERLSPWPQAHQKWHTFFV